MPLILRPMENGNYGLVEEAYVHGMMTGRALENALEWTPLYGIV